MYSPSASVRNHGPGQEVLQTGKRLVNIVNIEPVGHYAVKLVFSDGHDSGLYSWDYLYQLGRGRKRAGRSIWRDWRRQGEPGRVRRGHGCKSRLGGHPPPFFVSPKKKNDDRMGCVRSNKTLREATDALAHSRLSAARGFLDARHAVSGDKPAKRNRRSMKLKAWWMGQETI